MTQFFKTFICVLNFVDSVSNESGTIKINKQDLIFFSLRAKIFLKKNKKKTKECACGHTTKAKHYNKASVVVIEHCFLL